MLTLIVKPTEACNARCVYCSVEDKSARTQRMSDETLRSLFGRIAQALADGTADFVDITWHGGEPLLLGVEFYERMREIAAATLGADKLSRVFHTFQTNMTLFDDEWGKLFNALGVRMVGTSFDHKPGLRVLGSPPDSDRYNEAFFEGLGKLKRFGVGFGLIYVVTSRSIDEPEEVLSRLVNVVRIMGGTSIRVNSIYYEGEAKGKFNELGVSPEEYGHFIGRMFVAWHKRKHVYPEVQPLADLERRIVDPGLPGTCDESGVCGRTHLGIDHDGNIYQCGRSMDAYTLKYGSLDTHDFRSVFDNETKTTLDGRSGRLRLGACSECRFFSLCHGGCPVDSLRCGDIDERTPACASRKIMFERYIEPTLGIRIGTT